MCVFREQSIMLKQVLLDRVILRFIIQVKETHLLESGYAKISNDDRELYFFLRAVRPEKKI